MGKVAKGFSRAFGLNEGGTLNRALGGNSGMAAVIGLAAAIAIPFAAPAIAGAILGSSVVTGAFVATSAAVGAGLGTAAGALSGSLTGNMGRNALIGGAGGAVGGFLGANGLSYASDALFGPAEVAPTLTGSQASALQANYSPGAVATEPLGATTGVAAPEAATTGIGGGVSAQAPSPAYYGEVAAAGQAGVPASPVATAPPPATAAPQSWGERFMSGYSPAPVAGKPAAPGFFTAEGLGAAASRGVDSLTSPAAIAGIGQLALTMYNKPPEGLTPQERDYLRETAELAATNRSVYEQRVDAARRLLNQGTPNPEQAYAQTSLAYQRRAREAGLRSPEDMRRTMIDATRAGASAIPGEYARSYSATQAGLSTMPTSVPRGMESYGLEVQRDIERRNREYQASLAQAGGTLVGAFGGQRNKLFS